MTNEQRLDAIEQRLAVNDESWTRLEWFEASVMDTLCALVNGEPVDPSIRDWLTETKARHEESARRWREEQAARRAGV